MVSHAWINKLPGSGSALVSLEVNLNVLVPTVNLFGGAGFIKGHLIKNDPAKSPQLSVIKLISETVASALEVTPNMVIPFVI